MSFNPNLDVTITPAQETAINDAIQTILTTMAAIGVVNLSPEERKSLPTVAPVLCPTSTRPSMNWRLLFLPLWD